MPYKNLEDRNKRSREYYYEHKKERLKYEQNPKVKVRRLKEGKKVRNKKDYNEKKKVQQHDRKYYKPILLKLYKNHCMVKNCKEIKNLELHHINYEGGINMCQLLCLKHHHLIHR